MISKDARAENSVPEEKASKGELKAIRRGEREFAAGKFRQLIKGHERLLRAIGEL